MKLSWKKQGPTKWEALSCPPPHLGMRAQLSLRPDGTWHWEIRAVVGGELAGHWNYGKLLKQCNGVCPTVEEAMAAAEADMDEALA